MINLQLGVVSLRVLKQMSYKASLSRTIHSSAFSTSWWTERVALYGSTTVSETLGDGNTEKVSIILSGYSSLIFEMSKVPIPEPVPPPSEWHTWKPTNEQITNTVIKRKYKESKNCTFTSCKTHSAWIRYKQNNSPNFLENRKKVTLF